MYRGADALHCSGTCTVPTGTKYSTHGVVKAVTGTKLLVLHPTFHALAWAPKSHAMRLVASHDDETARSGMNCSWSTGHTYIPLIGRAQEY